MFFATFIVFSLWDWFVNAPNGLARRASRSRSVVSNFRASSHVRPVLATPVPQKKKRPAILGSAAVEEFRFPFSFCDSLASSVSSPPRAHTYNRRTRNNTWSAC